MFGAKKFKIGDLQNSVKIHFFDKNWTFDTVSSSVKEKRFSINGFCSGCCSPFKKVAPLYLEALFGWLEPGFIDAIDVLY